MRFWAVLLIAVMACGHKRSARAEWCTHGRTLDSAFIVDQARNALNTPGLVLTPSSLDHMTEGHLVRLLVSKPRETRGGGGLVFVDGETGCAIVLVRYE